MKKLNLDIQRFASTNKTANYNLPQFVGTDKPTWLGDFNQAMFDIDAGMHANASDIESVETIAQNASASASQASQDVAGLTSTVSTLSSDVTSATSTANNAQQTATSALNTANTANGKADTNASNITALTTRVSTNETNIDNLTGTILWTNPNMTAPFAPQTITLSSDDYDMLKVIYLYNLTSGLAGTQELYKGYGTRISYVASHMIGNNIVVERTLTRNSDTSFNLGPTSGASTEDNNIVPLYIIGYKTNLFS